MHKEYRGIRTYIERMYRHVYQVTVWPGHLSCVTCYRNMLRRECVVVGEWSHLLDLNPEGTPQVFIRRKKWRRNVSHTTCCRVIVV